MQYFAVLILSICIAFPVFSQNSNNNRERFRNLSDSMGQTVSNSSSNLEYYDEMTADSGNSKNYAYYSRKHDFLSKALKESEARLDLYIRTNDRPSIVKAERNNYERLIKQLESTKNEYDDWLSSMK